MCPWLFTATNITSAARSALADRRSGSMSPVTTAPLPLAQRRHSRPWLEGRERLRKTSPKSNQ
eukprot:3526487-Rhodomonas_salina.1